MLPDNVKSIIGLQDFKRRGYKENDTPAYVNKRITLFNFKKSKKEIKEVTVIILEACFKAGKV